MEINWGEHVPVLEWSVSSLPISNRALNVLRRYGIKTVENLTELELYELRDMRGFGPHCMEETLAALAELGLQLKPTNYATRR